MLWCLWHSTVWQTFWKILFTHPFFLLALMNGFRRCLLHYLLWHQAGSLACFLCLWICMQNEVWRVFWMFPHPPCEVKQFSSDWYVINPCCHCFSLLVIRGGRRLVTRTFSESNYEGQLSKKKKNKKTAHLGMNLIINVYMNVHGQHRGLL